MLKPQFDTHAIESISVTCEFTAEISAVGLDAIKVEAKRLQNRLPYRRIRRKAGQGTSAHDSLGNPSEIVGYMFYSKNMEEECDSFELHDTLATYTTKAYSNFNGFNADCLFYLDIANLAFTKSDAKLKRVIVRFINKFSSPEVNWEPRAALNADSKFLPKICLEREGDFWHFSVGVFGQALEGSHLLHNIKAHHGIRRNGDDLEDSEFVFTLESLHVNDFRDVDATGQSYSEKLDATIQNIRNQNSYILSEILSEELSARIGLKKPKQG